ncbi:MAG: flagellar protein FlaG [Thiomicrorhabdus sp.]|nr:flagellar protein FlaG [Thiomicrorhabdus sp.]
MATISGMQPSGSTAAPINSSIGNAIKSSVSGSLQGASQQEVTQKIEQKKADISQLKLQETTDSMNLRSQKPMDSTELDSLMQNLNTELKQLQNYMKFERDKDSQNMVVFIKDSETGELIRQIPTQEFLNISKTITQFLEMQKQSSEKISPPVGMLTNETA